jgi:hypothetical protein
MAPGLPRQFEGTVESEHVLFVELPEVCFKESPDFTQTDKPTPDSYSMEEE